jgi:hypothetical protein
MSLELPPFGWFPRQAVAWQACRLHWPVAGQCRFAPVGEACGQDQEEDTQHADQGKGTTQAQPDGRPLRLTRRRSCGRRERLRRRVARPGESRRSHSGIPSCLVSRAKMPNSKPRRGSSAWSRRPISSSGCSSGAPKLMLACYPVTLGKRHLPALSAAASARPSPSCWSPASEGSGGTVPGVFARRVAPITPGRRASLVGAALDLPEVQTSARLEVDASVGAIELAVDG